MSTHEPPLPAGAIGARPDARNSVLENPVALEPGSGGNIDVAITVDVERFAEAETQLAAGNVAREAPRHAPAGAGLVGHFYLGRAAWEASRPTLFAHRPDAPFTAGTLFLPLPGEPGARRAGPTVPW